MEMAVRLAATCDGAAPSAQAPLPVTHPEPKANRSPSCPRFGACEKSIEWIHAGGPSCDTCSSKQWTSTWFFEHKNTTIIQPKPLSVLHKSFLLFPPDFSVVETAKRTLVAQGPAKSRATFHFHSIWSTGSLCWDWKNLLAQCCSATPCLALHQAHVKQVRGMGRRTKHVKTDNSLRSQPSDTGLDSLPWWFHWFQSSYLGAEEEHCTTERTGAQDCDELSWYLMKLLLA